MFRLVRQEYHSDRLYASDDGLVLRYSSAAAVFVPVKYIEWGILTPTTATELAAVRALLEFVDQETPPYPEKFRHWPCGHQSNFTAMY